MLVYCESRIIRISLPGSSPGELLYMAHRYPTLLALIFLHLTSTTNTHTHSYIRYSLSFIRELNVHTRLCSVSFMPAVNGEFWVLNSHCSLYPTTTLPHTHCTVSRKDTHSHRIQSFCSSIHLSKCFFFFLNESCSKQ